MKKSPRIGFHAPIKGGIHEALIVARDVGCDTVQIFSRNPRAWLAKSLTPADVSVFRKVRRATKISPVLIHCNYLVNLAAADELMLEKSRASFREEVERAICSVSITWLFIRAVRVGLRDRRNCSPALLVLKLPARIKTRRLRIVWKTLRAR